MGFNSGFKGLKGNVSTRKNEHKSYHILIVYGILLTCFQTSSTNFGESVMKSFTLSLLEEIKLNLSQITPTVFNSINQRKQINASTVLAKKRKYTHCVKQRSTHTHINVNTNIYICTYTTAVPQM